MGIWFALLPIVMLCTRSFAKPSTNCGTHPADVVFVLDSSSSIWEPDFDKQLTFVEEVVSQFDIGMGDSQTRVGVMTFGHTHWIQFHLNSYTDRQSLMSAVKGVPYYPGYATETGDAIEYMTNTMFTADKGSREGVARIGIVITDGQSQDEKATQMAALAAREFGIQVFAIGVGIGADKLELDAIASSPSSKFVFMVDDYDALKSIKQIFAIRTCEVTLPPTTTTTTTITTTTVSSTVPSTTVMQGDRNEDLKSCGGKPADVFFVLDSSTSIWEEDFKKQLTFVSDVIDVFDIAENKTRVGVVTFSDHHQLVLPLDSQRSKESIKNAIQETEYVSGGTNTASVIKYIREEGFAVARQEVAHIAVIVTDGLSRDPQQTAAEAALLRNQGVYVFAIGVGNGVDGKELKNMANSPSDDYVFHVQNYDALAHIKNLLAVKTCKVNAELNDGPVCGKNIVSDVMFVYDAADLGSDKTALITDFVDHVSQKMDVSSGNIRVGRMTDNCPTLTDVPLSGSEAVMSLKTLQYSGLGNLISRVATYGFSESNGGRDTARSVVVLFLDSDSKELRAALHASKRLSNKSVFVVANSNTVDEDTALQFASTPNHLILVPTFRELTEMKDKIAERFCSVLN